VATYHSTMLNSRVTHSFTDVCWIVCMPTVAALFYRTVAMEVIGTSEFNDLKGCPKTFGNTVYMGMIRIHKVHDAWRRTTWCKHMSLSNQIDWWVSSVFPFLLKLFLDIFGEKKLIFVLLSKSCIMTIFSVILYHCCATLPLGNKKIFWGGGVRGGKFFNKSIKCS